MHKRPSARIAVVLAALLLSGAVVLSAPSPAIAHDDFVSSYPTAESTINGSPDEISLMFSGTLTDSDGATVVEVLDESGANVAVDPPTADGQSITQHLSADAATGVFTVRWKVVSADGHPISGEFSYTVEPITRGSETAPPTPSATPIPQASQDSAAEPEPAPSARTYGGIASGGGASELLPLLFLSGLALILGVGVVGVALAGRQRRRRDRAQAARDAAAAEEGPDA